MKQYDKALTAVSYIKDKIESIPEIVIILGSGLGKFADKIENKTEIKYENIPGFPVSTVEGHEGKLIFGTLNNRNIAAMQGRFHLYEGYDVKDVVLPIRVFALLGIKTLIVTNAAGAVNKSFNVGDLMIIEDHLSLFCPSPLTGKNEDEFGTRFPSMTRAYDKEYIDIAYETAKNLNINIRKGIYCYCKGPMFETPAEIKALRSLGADAAGMSTVPEVITAVHSGVKVLGISCMTNMAAGILDIPLTHKEVMETGKKVENDFSRYVGEIIAKI